ncbi:serine/arginine repetitive matrix protein 1-like [Camelus dromedarius]|uniref:serine/arginine repetitive matrix protein 1-like n=1 Tax=Camelus dromedarius TaxID=9838 RepID=UPI00311A54B5
MSAVPARRSPHGLMPERPSGQAPRRHKQRRQQQRRRRFGQDQSAEEERIGFEICAESGTKEATQTPAARGAERDGGVRNATRRATRRRRQQPWALRLRGRVGGSRNGRAGLKRQSRGLAFNGCVGTSGCGVTPPGTFRRPRRVRRGPLTSPGAHRRGPAPPRPAPGRPWMAKLPLRRPPGRRSG